jgi:hypothetical protein
MRSRWKVTALIAAALASAPVSAQVVGQNDTGTATETQERHSDGRDNDLLWNLLGLLGLLGLRGLWRESDNDGYTDDPV